MGCYVPQAIVKDGAVLDVDLVLSEVVEDGELLLVEYSTGPVAYTTRWAQNSEPAKGSLNGLLCNGFQGTL
jgi:hypothetical protein